MARLELDLVHVRSGSAFTVDTERLVLATGYAPRPQTLLAPIEALIVRDARGRPVIGRDHRIVLTGTTAGLYVQNAELHTHGVGAPDLGLGAYRAAVILNAVTGRELYRLPRRSAHTSFTPAAAAATDPGIRPAPVAASSRPYAVSCPSPSASSGSYAVSCPSPSASSAESSATSAAGPPNTAANSPAPARARHAQQRPAARPPAPPTSQPQIPSQPEDRRERRIRSTAHPLSGAVDVAGALHPAALRRGRAWAAGERGDSGPADPGTVEAGYPAAPAGPAGAADPAHPGPAPTGVDDPAGTPPDHSPDHC